MATGRVQYRAQAETRRAVVFDAGRLVQTGPHTTLIREAGPYAAQVAVWNRPLEEFA